MRLIQWRDKDVEHKLAAGCARLAGVLEVKLQDLAKISSSGSDLTEATLCSETYTDSQLVKIRLDLKACSPTRAERRGTKHTSWSV